MQESSPKDTPAESRAENTILILKPKDDSHRKAETYLRSRGWDIRTVTTVREAISLVNEQQFMPEFALLPTEHHERNVTMLPGLLKSKFKTKVIALFNRIPPNASLILEKFQTQSALTLPMSGPSIERMISKIRLGGDAAPTAAAEKKERAMAATKEDSVITIAGGKRRKVEDQKQIKLRGNAKATFKEQSPSEKKTPLIMMARNRGKKIEMELEPAPVLDRTVPKEAFTEAERDGDFDLFGAWGDTKKYDPKAEAPPEPEPTKESKSSAPDLASSSAEAASAATADGTTASAGSRKRSAPVFEQADAEEAKAKAAEANAREEEKIAKRAAALKAERAAEREAEEARRANEEKKRKAREVSAGSAADGANAAEEEATSAGFGARMKKNPAGEPILPDAKDAAASAKAEEAKTTETADLAAAAAASEAAQNRDGKAAPGANGLPSPTGTTGEGYAQAASAAAAPGSSAGSANGAPAGASATPRPNDAELSPLMDQVAPFFVKPPELAQSKGVGRDGKPRDLGVSFSLFEMAVMRALDITLLTIANDKPADSYSQCALAVNAEFGSGYLILTQDGAFSDFGHMNFFDTFKWELVSYLRAQDVEVDAQNISGLRLQSKEQGEWADRKAGFLSKAMKDGHHVAVGFFPNKEISIATYEAKREDLKQISLADLDGDAIVEFDVFLHLPINDRYIRYTPPGGRFLIEQKSRLKTRGVEHLHIKNEQVGNLTKYRAQNFLNGRIEEYVREIEKGAAKSG